jgi:hypothetical protein
MTADTATELEKARALYEKAQAAALAEQEEAAAKVAAEQTARDRAFLDGYDDEQLAADVQQARRDLRAAAAADPVFSALARVYALQLRRARLAA